MNVPVKDNPVVPSGIQRSMKPGEKRIFTLGFGPLEGGNQIISIRLDNNNQIDESDEGNNFAEKTIYINP
jgi:subtilase family serine protease